MQPGQLDILLENLCVLNFLFSTPSSYLQVLQKYMTIRFLSFFTLLCISSGFVQAQQLSDKAEIIVLTLGPNINRVETAFGHNAFRVIDKSQNIDRVYNYGVFDFDQPNFYLNFAKGYLNYKLDTVDYARFRYVYMYYNRFIHEQLLNLNKAQKQKVFDYLQWNMLPENQYYYYDYFYDNCATRIRDVLETTLGDQLHFDGSYITTDYTIRELTDLYLPALPWSDLGIDLCLGLPMDKTATPYMYMFLPDYIESAFEHASLKNDYTTLPLVKANRSTFNSVPVVSSTSLFNPHTFFYTILIIIILFSIRDYKRSKLTKWLDIPLFGLVGLLGLFFFLLWTVTDHQAAARNMNLLWAIPTHLILAIFLLRKQPPHWLRYYFIIALAIHIISLISWKWLPQLLLSSLIPLVIGLTLRCWLWVRLLHPKNLD